MALFLFILLLRSDAREEDEAPWIGGHRTMVHSRRYRQREARRADLRAGIRSLFADEVRPALFWERVVA